jgi:DNA-binding XRE family transcriptional regulator
MEKYHAIASGEGWAAKMSGVDKPVPVVLWALQHGQVVGLLQVGPGRLSPAEDEENSRLLFYCRPALDVCQACATPCRCTRKPLLGEPIHESPAPLELRFRAVRDALGMTQQEIATALGIGCRSWRSYERGEQTPGAQVLEGLCRLGVNPWWLLAGKGEVLCAPPPGDNRAGE